MADFVTALGLVLVIEGLLLALLPDRLKSLLALVLAHPAARLRVGGLAAAGLGLLIVWLVRG